MIAAHDAGSPADRFLALLHPCGFRDLRAFSVGSKGAAVRSVAADDLDGVTAFAVEFDRRDVYVGVASRATKAGRGAEHCLELHALFVDLDFKDFDSEASARERLHAFPLTPSAIVASGGGLHVYWLLSEPIPLERPEQRAFAARHLKALVGATGGDWKSAEPAHILRLPGTRNFKYSPPRDVTIEQFDESRRYRLGDFSCLDVRPDGGREQGTPSPMEQPACLPADIPEGGRNDALFREGCRLRRLGHEVSTIHAALNDINRTRCHPPLPDHEVATIAQSCARYEPASKTFPCSESGDAAFFAARYADSVRFDHRAARWLVLDDASGIWQPDRDGCITRVALAAMRERQQLALSIGDSDRRKRAADWTFRGESRSRLSNLLTLVRDFEPVADTGDRWDAIPHLLGTPTGVVDLRTGVTRRADPDERVTMQTAVPYDPEARSALWDNALAEIFPDPDEQAYVQVAVGYSATAEMGLDKWFLPHGPKGRNGKGTILGAVRAALHDYAIELDASTFDRRAGTAFNLAKLPGKRFVHCAEAGDSTTLHHDRIKQISGGDEVMAGDKHQRAFAFHPVCKLWFSCNTTPKVTDESAAFWARVQVIFFAQSFYGRENFALRDALRQDPAHQAAVLRWIVEGARQFYERGGLGTMPPAFQAATEEFQLENDRLADFYAECCMLDNSQNCGAAELWDAYSQWAVGAHIRYPIGRKTFYQQLEKQIPEDEKRGREALSRRESGIA